MERKTNCLLTYTWLTNGIQYTFPIQYAALRHHRKYLQLFNSGLEFWVRIGSHVHFFHQKHFRDSIEATKSVCARHHCANISFFPLRFCCSSDVFINSIFFIHASRCIFSRYNQICASKCDTKFCNRNNTISYKMNFYSMKWCFWIRGVVAL